MKQNLMRRESKLITQCPEGYEFQLFKCTDGIKIIGIHPDKKPICYIVGIDSEWKEIEPKFTPEDT